MENVCLKENNLNVSSPLVSVAITAYNVGPFISEAIESVLKQKVNFSFEIVIGEDFSTDQTRSICLSYKKQYPKLIKLILNEKNLGLTPNWVNTLNNCTGKYIALLDGDDYWTDPFKLNKQINFLENNLQFSACAHQTLKIYFDNENSELFGLDTDTIFTLKDTLSHRKFHTSSVVFRRSIWLKYPDFPISIISNERLLYPILAINGPIYYFKDCMGIYRLSNQNLTSRITYKELETDIAMLSYLKKIYSDFPIYRFRSFLHLCIYTYGKKTKTLPLLKHYVYFVFFSFSYFPSNLKDVYWGTKFILQRIF